MPLVVDREGEQVDSAPDDGHGNSAEDQEQRNGWEIEHGTRDRAQDTECDLRHDDRLHVAIREQPHGAESESGCP